MHHTGTSTPRHIYTHKVRIYPLYIYNTMVRLHFVIYIHHKGTFTPRKLYTSIPLTIRPSFPVKSVKILSQHVTTGVRLHPVIYIYTSLSISQ